MKREDLCRLAGTNGAKARTVWYLARGARGIVGVAARESPMMFTVPRVACGLGIACRIHTAAGEDTAGMVDARHHGAEVLCHHPGYMNVILARARNDQPGLGWRHIPLGAAGPLNRSFTAAQTANIPEGVKRIVVVCGSGATAAAILWGLATQGRQIPLVGVQVGLDPHKSLDQWAPPHWRRNLRIVNPELPYARHVVAEYSGVLLDPVYEAKAVPYLRPDDLLWVVAIRASLQGDPK